MAFLYMVLASDGSRKFFVQIASCFTSRIANVAWQDNPCLPEFESGIPDTGTVEPDVDLEESIHEFESESEALLFMAKHYANQLNPFGELE